MEQYDLERLLRSVAMLGPGAAALEREEAIRLLRGYLDTIGELEDRRRRIAEAIHLLEGGET